MFEFHGWVTIRVPFNDDEDTSIFEQRENDAISSLQNVLNDLEKEFPSFCILEIRRIGNGLNICDLHGLRNHRYEPVIKLFDWIAHNLPESYGLLYVHDDEYLQYDNKFRVWSIALGVIKEFEDTYLSPVIATVEKPYVPPDNWRDIRGVTNG